MDVEFTVGARFTVVWSNGHGKTLFEVVESLDPNIPFVFKVIAETEVGSDN